MKPGARLENPHQRAVSGPHRTASRGLSLFFSTRQRSPYTARYIQHLKRTSGLSRIEIKYHVNPGQDSLALLYNRFLERARYDIICLVHDDLHFQRQARWGRQVIQAFRSYPQYALLGAAGSVQLKEHGIFWLPPETLLGRVRHPLQGRWHTSAYSEIFAEPLEALVLDGLFLAVHRQRLQTRFDERLKGFHFYDIALSLSQSLAAERQQGGACGVLTQLKIGHRSPGTPDPVFEAARERFARLYQAALPRSLRPRLHITECPGPTQGPALQVLIWHHSPPISLQPLLQRLQHSRYTQTQLTLLNAVQPGPQSSGSTGVAQVRQVQEIPISPSASWTQLLPILKALLLRSAAEYVLLLDSRVLPLHDWLPGLMKHYLHTDAGQWGSLCPRLHYADSHFIYQNGLQLQRDGQGLYDIRHRGIHSPYCYQRALEWQTLGGSAAALLLRRTQFLESVEQMQQNWVPGLELNLALLLQGYANAVDSRLVGYWLSEDTQPTPAQEQAELRRYRRFQNHLNAWLREHQTHPALQRHL